MFLLRFESKSGSLNLNSVKPYVCLDCELPMLYIPIKIQMFTCTCNTWIGAVYTAKSAERVADEILHEYLLKVVYILKGQYRHDQQGMEREY